MADYQPAAHYDRVTPAWALLMGDDLHYGVFDGPQGAATPLAAATERLTDVMIEHAQLAPGLDVLDNGCGSGGPAARLVAEHGVNVLGITTSAVGVESATARFAELGLAGGRFEQRDSTDNGLPDESFDRAWALESSHLMPDRGALVEESARVLRPGGRLALCDIVRRRDVPFLELRERRAEFAVLRAAFGAARMDRLEQYVAHAEAAGLAPETQLDLTVETRPTFDAWRANAELHHDAVVELIGADGLDTFLAALDILERFWDDGTLGYGIVTAVKP